MDHYIDVSILPDPEFKPMLIMNALYAKLHQALVILKNNSIGISFPEYQLDKVSFGKRIRLHSSAQQLNKLMTTHWLIGVRDHIYVGDISQIPNQLKNYAICQRIQVKSNVERIRRRHMKRNNITYEQVVAKIPNNVEKRLKLPFIHASSQSTNQKFRLFIKQKLVRVEKLGSFNCYGLSAEATVPFFQ